MARRTSQSAAATASPSQTRYVEIGTAADPFPLADGSRIGPCVLAYETYGALSAKRDNAVLVFHALTGSHHAAGVDPVGPGGDLWTEECHVGWWDEFIGPGKALDTDKYFVICANYLGSCYGSSGPNSIDPRSGRPYGRDFPWPQISDVVDANIKLLDHLEVEYLLAVTGGSLGGCAAMDLARRYPNRVHCVIPIAAGLRATVLSKTHLFEQIFAIESDPNFCGGQYYTGPRPDRGLALARMISHKTFVSLSVLETRARNEIVQPSDVLSCYQLQDRIESYMLHQGRKFVSRFDANSYLRLANLWQSWDLAKQAEMPAAQAFVPCQAQHWLVFSIDGDVCFYPDEQDEIVQALKANAIDVQHITVHTEKGHDSFLLEPHLYTPHIVFKLAYMLTH